MISRRATYRVNFRENIYKIFFSETIRGMTLVKDIRFYINCVFCYDRRRTLVAMATYIFHRLIMKKVEIDNFSVLMGIVGFFTEMFIQ